MAVAAGAFGLLGVAAFAWIVAVSWTVLSAALGTRGRVRHAWRPPRG